MTVRHGLTILLLAALSTSIPACYQAPVRTTGEFPPAVEAGAARLAQERYPTNATARKDYRQSLISLYNSLGSANFLMVYNTGGFGGTAMAVDPDWGSIVRGIAATLQEKGHLPAIVEHQRSRYGVRGTAGEIIDMWRGYPNKAARLAQKLGFLLQYKRDLKVIVTGRSHGAVFANQVMKLMEGRPRTYAVLAGTPFWYRGNFGSSTLLIDSNGTQPDAFRTADWGRIIRANLRLPRTQPPPGGAIQILKWYINMPGHEYTWQYPAVQSKIRQFLDKIER